MSLKKNEYSENLKLISEVLRFLEKNFNLDDPECNPIHDINKDGHVGIDDIVTTADHFGEIKHPKL